MWQQKTIRKISALVLLIILGLITLYGLWSYISYFLSAIVLYVLFLPIYSLLTEKWNWPKSISALTVIFVTIVVIVAPLVSISLITINQIQTILQDGSFFKNLEELVRAVAPNVNLREALQDQIATLAGTASNLLLTITSNLNYWFVGIMLMYFALYFLFITDKNKMIQLALDYIPFNQDNSIKILSEFKLVTKAVLVSNLLMAIIQGTIFGLGFYLAGIQGAVIWGFVAFILSFLPIVGPILVAVPTIAILLVNGNYYGAMIITFLSIILTLNDSFLRPIIQKEMGDIHPMVSVSGFIMGVVLFGMIGIVIGPILLSYFIITLKMFAQEYVEKDKPEEEVYKKTTRIDFTKAKNAIISAIKK